MSTNGSNMVYEQFKTELAVAAFRVACRRRMLQREVFDDLKQEAIALLLAEGSTAAQVAADGQARWRIAIKVTQQAADKLRKEIGPPRKAEHRPTSLVEAADMLEERGDPALCMLLREEVDKVLSTTTNTEMATMIASDTDNVEELAALTGTPAAEVERELSNRTRDNTCYRQRLARIRKRVQARQAWPISVVLALTLGLFSGGILRAADDFATRPMPALASIQHAMLGASTSGQANDAEHRWMESVQPIQHEAFGPGVMSSIQHRAGTADLPSIRDERFDADAMSSNQHGRESHDSTTKFVEKNIVKMDVPAVVALTSLQHARD